MGMRIGLDISTFTPRRTGVGRYTELLLAALLDNPGVDEVRVFAPCPTRIDRLPEHPKLTLRTAGAGRRMLWLYRRLPDQVRADPVDVFHFPNYLGPALSPIPKVVTVHDLSIYRLPALVPWRRRLAHRWLLPSSIRSAARIIAVSDATRDELVERFPDIAERIRVVPEAAPPMQRVEDPAALTAVRARYGLPEQFVFSPGAREPRKNAPVLLAAVDRLRRGPVPGLVAVITGNGPRPPSRREGCIDLGFVPPADLAAVYSAATVVAYPSRWEGFGLPTLEAFACGTPLVASTAGAIPSVVGDAGLLVDPADTDGLTLALRRVLTDSTLSAGLVTKGYDRVKGFSWADTAARTIAVYREAAGR